jgi:hypothetical protein
MRGKLFVTPAMAAALAIVPIVGVPTQSAKVGQHGGLHATSSSDPPQLLGLGPSGCTHVNPDTGRCLVDFFQHDTFSGDVNGQQDNAGSLSVQPATVTGDAVSLGSFRGTVRGCPGPGTATFRWLVRLGAKPGHNIGTSHVVAGAGSGGLATLEGSARVDATPNPDGTITAIDEFNLHCPASH